MLAVPVGLMRFLRKGMLFKPELTEDGILYRFVEPEPKPVVVPPRWAAPKPEGQ
jgi:hypothetical protein